MTVSVVRDEFPVNHAPINEVSCGGAEVNHSGDHRRCRAFAIRRKNPSGVPLERATERPPLAVGVRHSLTIPARAGPVPPLLSPPCVAHRSLVREPGDAAVLVVVRG